MFEECTVDPAAIMSAAEDVVNEVLSVLPENYREFRLLVGAQSGEMREAREFGGDRWCFGSDLAFRTRNLGWEYLTIPRDNSGPMLARQGHLRLRSHVGIVFVGFPNLDAAVALMLAFRTGGIQFAHMHDLLIRLGHEPATKLIQRLTGQSIFSHMPMLS